MQRMFMAAQAILLVMLVSGCGALMHPRAGEYLEQAKGKTGTETLSNLLSRMESSAKAARAGQEVDVNLSALHDQQYAFWKALCGVTDAETKTTAYVKLGTLTRELRPIMHRLIHAKENQAVRESHLDLYLKRIDELREALSAMRV